MMSVIPGWAVGVGFIVSVVAIAQIVVVKLRASVRLPAPDPGVGELRQDLDAMQHRLGELEERLDFTERLLTKPGETDRHNLQP